MKFLKKAASLVLSAALAVSLVPQAAFAADSWKAPSTNVWATDLSVFNLKSSSEPDHNYKKLQFGKYNGKAINWYIAGADSKHADLLGYELDGGSDTPWRPFGLGAFNSDGRNFKPWKDSYGNYTDRTMLDTDEVGPNHYGASDIRAFLNNEALEGFSDAELEMIQMTTLTIADYLNKDNNGAYPSHYTVSDKLYLPNGDPKLEDPLYIYLGSDGSLKVPLPDYKDTSHPFYVPRSFIWLAAPYYELMLNGYPPLCASTYYRVQNVLLAQAIQQGSASIGACPACSLDLSSVLFSSAVPLGTASGIKGAILTGDEPLVIRHRDEGDFPETAGLKVDLSAKTITVTPGSSKASIRLVVQGKDDSTDWYFERPISSRTVVTEAEIKQALASGGVSVTGGLSGQCKVWIEYTDPVSNVVYSKTDEPLPTDISDATLEASGSPAYKNGEVIAPDEFDIEVTLDGMKLPADAYILNLYPDAGCTPGSEITPITDAGVFYAVAIGSESQGYVGITAAMKVKVTKAALPKPTAVTGTITYNGNEQTGVALPAGADPARYKITGDKATDAGTYQASVALADPNNYCWAGESGDPEDKNISKPFTIDWEIKPPLAGDYKIILGMNQTVYTDANSAKFASDADFSKFDHVEVDGKTVAKKYYTAESGSTVITFNRKFIKTLSIGKHKLTIVSKDGSAKTSFNVADPLPKTGDTATPFLWLGMCMLAIFSVLMLRRKAYRS